MEIFEVNKETCLRDGICAAICPPGIIDFEPGDYPRPSPAAEEICITCGHCVAVCPTGSLTHRKMPVEKCPPLEESKAVSLDNFEYLLRKRRSIRAYADRPVTRDILTRLIEAARYSPTGGNSQSVEWLVIDDRANLDRLRDIGADWMRREVEIKSPIAPMVERILKSREKGLDEFLRDAPALIVVHDIKENPIAAWNCAIALTNFEMAANCIGLGCCCIGFVVQAANNYPSFAEFLSVPPDRQVYGAVVTGYPKYGYRRLPLRRPPKITWKKK